MADAKLTSVEDAVAAERRGPATRSSLATAALDSSGVVDKSGYPPRWPSPLPLGWTQIRRSGKKRPRYDVSSDGTSATAVGRSAAWCCEDLECADDLNTMSENVASGGGEDGGGAKSAEKGRTELRGRAVLLLPDVDSTWFQGHFIPSAGVDAKTKPMGILAVDRSDTDDCLKCAEGGYREVSELK